MPSHLSSPRNSYRTLLPFLVAIVASAQAPLSALAVAPLQLEVFINDAPANLIGSFSTEDGIHLSAEPAELAELGLDPSRFKSVEGPVSLDRISGLSYRYDVPGQRIFLEIDTQLRGTVSYDASPAADGQLVAESGYGTVLNYNLYAALVGDSQTSDSAFNGASASLDARAFSPYGTLNQSAILRMTDGGHTDALRLDTAYTYSDPDTMMTYRAGDLVSGGFAWTRPIRMGGLQARRNFNLRSDLITQPLASVEGSAAVPSTIDVYINNLKTYSRDIDAGGYQINNLPITSGSGQARVVLRDAAGHEQQTIVPFYASPSLLRPGLIDMSFEAGLPRLGYATTDDTYLADSPVATASLRMGLSDWITLESHAELGGGLVNGGAGVVARTGTFGVASFALSGSRHNDDSGVQAYGGYETSVGSINLSASSQVTFGTYDDLASITGRRQDGKLRNRQLFLDFLGEDIDAKPTDFRVPKMVNRITASTPLSFDIGTISASYIDRWPAAGERSQFVTASYSRPTPFGGNFDTTAFAELGGDNYAGVFAALSFPLGGDMTATTAVSADRDGANIVSDVVKPLGNEPGSVGWRAAVRGGREAAQSATLSYRSKYGRAEAGVGRNRNGLTGTAQIDGAIATLGSGVFLTGRVDDAFAVVDTGLPNVRVLYENRPMGVTDANGRLVVPNLRSYQRNKFSIDTLDLPVNAEIPTTEREVAPADRSGVRVDLGVRKDTQSAIIVLSTSDGTFVPPGAHGQLTGKSEFIVGYDGRAYVKSLADRNDIIVTWADGECRASFPFRPKGDGQLVVPVTCR